MPKIGPITCNSGIPVPCPSKYSLNMFPIEAGCFAIMGDGYGIILDFDGAEWAGTSDGMSGSIGYGGLQAGVPKWPVTGAHLECGGGTKSWVSNCPMDAYTVQFLGLSGLCCPTNPNGAFLGVGGLSDSTGEIVELAPCDDCFPNVSSQPVRYASGEVILKGSELSVKGFGMPWGQSRRIATRQTISETMGGGMLWQSPQASFLTVIKSTLMATNKNVLRVTIQGGGSGQGIKFARDNQGNFNPKFDNVTRLTYDSVSKKYASTSSNGTKLGDGTLQVTQCNAPPLRAISRHSTPTIFQPGRHLA